MRRSVRCFLLCGLMLFLTGCVKFNANMDIKKNKSMDFSIIYAVDKNLLGNQEVFEDYQKEQLKKNGFTIRKYSQGNMTGYKLLLHVKNIDKISSSDNVSYSLSGMLDDNSNRDQYLFKVKKGFLKNTYVARFQFSASDSKFSNDSTTTESEDSTDSSNDTDSEDDDSTLSFDNDSSDFDFSSMMSNLDLSFHVILPYAAKSHNATSTSDNNKKLSWNLSSNGSDDIHFEFALYNRFTIGVCVIVVLGILGFVVWFFLRKKKNGRNHLPPTNPSGNVEPSGLISSPTNVSSPSQFGTLPDANQTVANSSGWNHPSSM